MAHPAAFRALFIVLGLVAALLAPPAAAQNPFETVALVNDGVVTRFEVVQRERLQRVLRTPGASREIALQSLIDDRLKLGAAGDAGISPTEEDIQFGLEDFAGRANLTAEELIIAVGQVGIDEETLRDYVRVLISWGEVIRERFTARARPSEAEIDRAIALGSGQSGTRVLVSEIVLPVDSREIAAASEERAAAIAELRSFDAFSAAARRFSVAPSRTDGGRLDWRPLSAMPPQIAPLFLTLQPGDVTPPVVLAEGIALYQLRALEDTTPRVGSAVSIDYALVRFAPGTDLAAERARILRVTDTCDDLYGVFKGAGEDRLDRETGPLGDLPRAIANATQTLDPGEIALIGPQAAGGGGGALVMLCERTPIREEELTRGDIERQLFVRRLEAFGDSFLAQLRADAFIEIVE